jgi:hypothetical protein
MDWDDESQRRAGIGAGAGAPRAFDVVRYVAGCVQRERERVARLLRAAHVEDQLVAAVLDEADDAKVFRWRGPGAKLDDPFAPAEINGRAQEHHG